MNPIAQGKLKSELLLCYPSYRARGRSWQFLCMRQCSFAFVYLKPFLPETHFLKLFNRPLFQGSSPSLPFPAGGCRHAGPRAALPAGPPSPNRPPRARGSRAWPAPPVGTICHLQTRRTPGPPSGPLLESTTQQSSRWDPFKGLRPVGARGGHSRAAVSTHRHRGGLTKGLPGPRIKAPYNLGLMTAAREEKPAASPRPGHCCGTRGPALLLPSHSKLKRGKRKPFPPKDLAEYTVALFIFT